MKQIKQIGLFGEDIASFSNVLISYYRDLFEGIDCSDTYAYFKKFQDGLHISQAIFVVGDISPKIREDLVICLQTGIDDIYVYLQNSEESLMERYCQVEELLREYGFSNHTYIQGEIEFLLEDMYTSGTKQKKLEKSVSH